MFTPEEVVQSVRADMDPDEADRIVLAWYSKLLLEGIEQVRIYRSIRKEHPNFWALTPLPQLLETVRQRLAAVLDLAGRIE